MYVDLVENNIEWLMFTLFIIGVLFILLIAVVYLLIELLSTKAIPIVCPNCERTTKMMGSVDACMHCKQSLTLDKDLEGKEFDEKYNTRRYQRETEVNEEK